MSDLPWVLKPLQPHGVMQRAEILIVSVPTDTSESSPGKMQMHGVRALTAAWRREPKLKHTSHRFLELLMVFGRHNLTGHSKVLIIGRQVSRGMIQVTDLGIRLGLHTTPVMEILCIRFKDVPTRIHSGRCVC